MQSRGLHSMTLRFHPPVLMHIFNLRIKKTLVERGILKDFFLILQKHRYVWLRWKGWCIDKRTMQSKKVQRKQTWRTNRDLHLT